MLTKWGLRSTGLTQAPAVTLYAKNHAHTRTQIHAEWVILKPKICLAPMLFWHSIWQSFKSLLHPLVEPKHQKKQTAAVGIKVSVGVCVRARVCSSYLQHSAFCSLRIFMAVRYAENLTLFKSATGRKGDREIKGKWTKKENRGRKLENKMQQKSAFWATQATSVFSEIWLLLVIVCGDGWGERLLIWTV